MTPIDVPARFCCDDRFLSTVTKTSKCSAAAASTVLGAPPTHLQDGFDLVSNEVARQARAAMALVANGQVRIDVTEVFPLGEAREAHRRLEGRRTTGKLLLSVNGSAPIESR